MGLTRLLPLVALLLSGTAHGQTVPTFTGPTGLQAQQGDPIKQAEVRAGYGIKQDFTGAIAVNTYGTNRAACTGGDDYPAFTAAIAAASAKGGGTVVVPNASCLTSASIALPAKVRLVGLGPASQITPTASMQAVVRVTGGQNAIENVGFQQAGSLAATGVTIAKGDGNVLPTDLIQLTVIGFPKGVRYVSGDTVRVIGGFYFNNTVAFAYEPQTFSTVNHVISGGTLVQGGSGIDLPAIISGTIYPHVEGLLISDLQVVQGVDNGFCLRVSAGVHVVWRGGMCAEARTGGYGIRLINTADVIRSVEIGDVFIGANPDATGMLGGVSIAAPATAVKLHDLHFSSWRAVPLALDPGSAGTAQVSIARVSFDGTVASSDIYAASARVTLLQPQYDVASGVATGTGGIVTEIGAAGRIVESAAPPAPATGATVFVDAADHKLKAIGAGGTITTLAAP